ncbi:MAG: hypothetical protein LUM44_09890 [Pyrinomonadaceae bacterium]|nr:hypothetical protein [Pyrinomonadaceae bacterium]
MSDSQEIYRGFLELSEAERAEYLNYFNLLIEKQHKGKERNQLSRFKRKLEKAKGNNRITTNK